ncbi:MAG: branched-chain amino acid ABC transporter permease [Dehalococcoidia bacterium]
MDITTLLTPRKLVPAGLLLLILVVLATFPIYGLPGYYTVLVGTIFMFTILAVSWAMFSGATGYMSLAPAAFFGVGIYASALLFGRGRELLPLPAAVVAGGVITFVLAFVVGLVTLRLKGIYFTIFTFGLVLFARELVQYWEHNIIGKRGQYIAFASEQTVYYILLGVLVATLLAVYFIRRSRYGLAMQSIGGNEAAAAHMGVNTTMLKVLTFAISAFFMGAAGAAMGPRLIYIDPGIAFNPLYSFMPVLMAVFGGMGQLYGPVIGGVLFAYLERTLRLEWPGYFMLGFGVILIVVILFLPGGLASLIERGRHRLRGVMPKLWKREEGEQHANT